MLFIKICKGNIKANFHIYKGLLEVVFDLYKGLVEVIYLRLLYLIINFGLNIF